MDSVEQVVICADKREDEGLAPLVLLVPGSATLVLLVPGSATVVDGVVSCGALMHS